MFYHGQYSLINEEAYAIMGYFSKVQVFEKYFKFNTQYRNCVKSITDTDKNKYVNMFLTKYNI